MKTWTMNEQTVKQIEYYISRMQDARARNESSLREVIANLFSREHNAAKDVSIAPAYMKPLSIPMDSAYVLADYIIELTARQCEATELFMEDRTAAIDQWLNETAEACATAEELVQRYHLIEQGLQRAVASFRGASIGPLTPYKGEVTLEAAYAMRGRIVSMITAMNPSEEALRLMSRQLRETKYGTVARFEHFAHGGMEIKAMSAAVIYALRCDGTLPAETDEIMLEQIVCEVCRDIDMQAVADTMHLSQETYSTVFTLLGGAFVIGVAGALFSMINASNVAALGAAIVANPAVAIVASVAIIAVLPFVFEQVVNLIHDGANTAARFVREHEEQITAAKQASRTAREKCAAIFDKLAEYAKEHVIEPIIEQIAQPAEVQNAQQAVQTTQS